MPIFSPDVMTAFKLSPADVEAGVTLNDIAAREDVSYELRRKAFLQVIAAMHLSRLITKNDVTIIWARSIEKWPWLREARSPI